MNEDEKNEKPESETIGQLTARLLKQGANAKDLRVLTDEIAKYATNVCIALHREHFTLIPKEKTKL